MDVILSCTASWPLVMTSSGLRCHLGTLNFRQKTNISMLVFLFVYL